MFIYIFEYDIFCNIILKTKLLLIFDCNSNFLHFILIYLCSFALANFKSNQKFKYQNECICHIRISSDRPISITEDANGFHLNGDTTEEQEEPSSVTWIENDDDANKYQEKIKKEHTSVEEECQRLQDSMEDVDVDSTGETEADVMVNMLLNQKPGGPKIFYSRDNV